MMRKRRTHNSDVPLGAPADTEQESFRISTIPDDFYGGKNPDIYHVAKKNEEQPAKEVATPAAPEPSPEPVLPPVPQTVPPPPEVPPKQQLDRPTPKKHMWRYIVVAIVLLLVVTLYVLITSGVFRSAPESTPPSPPVVVTPPPPVDPEPEPVVEPEPVAPTSTDSGIEAPTSTVDVANLPIVFPRLNNTESVDLDGDELTDAAEAVFETDPGKWDTDGDGYYDGQELRNLYNPTGFAPVRLIDSALVRSYRNPVWGYQLYYPDTWDVSLIDTDARELIISSIASDYITIYVRNRLEDQTLSEWLRTNSDENIRDYRIIQNRFDVPVLMRSDRLVGVVEDNDVIYVVVYYPDTSSAVSYRAVMDIVLQSMLLDGDVATIPTQTTIPQNNTSTES